MKPALSLSWICLVTSLLILSSCGKSAFYEKNLHVTSDAWKQGDTLYYQVPVTDTVHYFDFYLNVRNSTSYRYRNLFLFINTKFPGGGISRDTVECILAGADGKWYGKGMGKIKDSRILFKKAVRFPHAGTYLIGIEQGMREIKLDGIHDIGVRIEKH